MVPKVLPEMETLKAKLERGASAALLTHFHFPRNRREQTRAQPLTIDTEQTRCGATPAKRVSCIIYKRGKHRLDE